MRITGGEWASRRVAGPPRDGAVRPTPDALREQGFAVLSPLLAGAVFLDLFAGTGAVSLEALSRGAARAIAVEQARAGIGLIRRNAEALGVGTERLELLAMDAGHAVERLAAAGVRCTVGWCDPPFAAWHAGVAVLARARVLGVFAEGAAVVLERPEKQAVELASFEVVRALRGAVLLRAV